MVIYYLVEHRKSIALHHVCEIRSRAVQVFDLRWRTDVPTDRRAVWKLFDHHDADESFRYLNSTQHTAHGTRQVSHSRGLAGCDFSQQKTFAKVPYQFGNLDHAGDRTCLVIDHKELHRSFSFCPGLNFDKLWVPVVDL